MGRLEVGAGMMGFCKSSADAVRLAWAIREIVEKEVGG